MNLLDSILNFLKTTGIARLIEQPDFWKTVIMFAIAFVLAYLAIVKQFEPLLLLPIAIGMLLTNIPGANIFHLDFFIDPAGVDYGRVLHDGGFLDMLYLGVKLGIYPSLIFIGIGAMTDFSPLISNPQSLLIGAGAQLGVFVAFAAALMSGVFTPEQAAAIGIIGGADGPTSLFLAGKWSGEARSVMSSLYFEPVEKICWKPNFMEKEREDLIIYEDSKRFAQ